MNFRKYLIILPICFFTFISHADTNEGVFVELTTAVSMIEGSILGRVYIANVGGGVGYKYNLYNSSKNYLGYLQTDASLPAVFVGDKFPDDYYTTNVFFNFEYGYEFMRERPFSFGFNGSPIMLIAKMRSLWSWDVGSFIGVFENIKVKDSFFISIEGQSIFVWENFIVHNWQPYIRLKGKYFF